MKFLKGLAVSFLSLVLFLSLALFTTVFVLNQTLLNSKFVGKELDNLPISQLARELAPQFMKDVQITGLPAGIDQKLINDAIVNVATYTIAKYEPELKSEAKTAISDAYNYFGGKTANINISFNLTGIKSTLKDTLRQNILVEINSLPPVPGYPPEILKQMLSGMMVDQMYEELATQIPDTYAVNETNISSDAMSQLKQIKMFVGYYQLFFKVLIGVIVLCVALIVLVERNLKGTTRSLGLNLLFFGGVGYAIDFLFNSFAPNYANSLINQMAIGGASIPPSILTWLMKFMDDMMAPLQTLSIAILITGAVLFIASFFLKSPEAKIE